MKIYCVKIKSIKYNIRNDFGQIWLKKLKNRQFKTIINKNLLV